MGEIRVGQKTKLRFRTTDNAIKEVDCAVKKVYSDRLVLQFIGGLSKEIIDYSDYFEEGRDISVRIFTPVGVEIFDAMILNSPFGSDFVIEYVDDPLQLQRREYTRVPLDTKIIIERPEEGNIVTHTVDLSGGSLKFVYDDFLSNGEELNALLYLPYELRSFSVQGIVKKQDYMGEDEYVLSFTKLEERDRDKIIKRCFDIQASILKNIEESEEI